MMERLIKWVTIAVIALFVFVFVVAAPAYTIASYHNENTYVIKVTDKETKTHRCRTSRPHRRVTVRLNSRASLTQNEPKACLR